MDKRACHKVALYGLVRTRHERLLFVLSRAFCVQCGWERTDYMDESNPGDGADSAWHRLLEDLTDGRFDAVIVFQNFKNLDAYCEHYGTCLTLIHPDTSSALPPGSWRRVRVQ